MKYYFVAIRYRWILNAKMEYPHTLDKLCIIISLSYAQLTVNKQSESILRFAEGPRPSARRSHPLLKSPNCFYFQLIFMNSTTVVTWTDCRTVLPCKLKEKRDDDPCFDEINQCIPPYTTYRPLTSKCRRYDTYFTQVYLTMLLQI